MKISSILLSLMLMFSFSHSAEAQLFGKKKKKKEPTEEKKKPEKEKSYDKVITKEAITNKGLFTTHKVEDKYYFEIPDTLLEKEVLVTSRVSGFVKGLNFGGAGVRSRPQQVIRWQKKDKKILLRSVSYNSVASFEDPIYKSVKNNNYEPVIMIFDIETMPKDSNSYVINIEKLFTTEVPMIGAVSASQAKRFGLKGVDKSRSYINEMKAFPENVNIKHVLTYKGNKLPDNNITETMSIEMTQSFILLPANPMQPRLYDPRVSYFSLSQVDYSADEHSAFKKRYITRWRLEPKDPEAYARGELVEPVKQIVYYIDPATPEKWRPYLMNGVNDWNIAFEKAGFKNAIVAKLPPSKEEDPDWSPEDVRYSVIRYVSTDIQNAMGPHVHDPRTGEIIESDIIWYHNVMRLLRNWFFVQTAAINPEARTPKFKEEVMGRLIQFVAAHEVGHTLGLPHNMGASVAYPVDSLRSASFTKKMGTAPSIMDYARFNYVAQPEDGDVGLMPNIGIYDKWSIEFGYRLFLDMDSPEAERDTLNKLIVEKADNPYYRFGRQRGRAVDPSAQTEDLGDNSMRASELGIKNLERIVPNLIEWTAEGTKDFSELKDIYNSVFGQYRRYIGHVTSNVGGVYEFYKTSDEQEPIYTHVEKAKQKDAIRFLNQQLFETPTWLIDEDILRRIEETGIVERIRGLQDGALGNILDTKRLHRMLENTALNDNSAYSVNELLDDLIDGIFKETNTTNPTDIYRRNLQRTFVDQLGKVINEKEEEYRNTDMVALSRGKLKELQSKMSSAQSNDPITQYHYDELADRIKTLLDEKE